MSMIQLASSASHAVSPWPSWDWADKLMLPLYSIDISLNINMESSCSISRHSKTWEVLGIWHDQANFHKEKKCCLYVPYLTLLIFLKDFHGASFAIFRRCLFVAKHFESDSQGWGVWKQGQEIKPWPFAEVEINLPLCYIKNIYYLLSPFQLPSWESVGPQERRHTKLLT